MSEQSWQPPANPDPREISRSAAFDHRDGHYADALAKHLWFFHHVLEIEESYSAVRLSFALSDWKRLADDYPPAYQALTETRDACECHFLDSPGFATFRDAAALNSVLNETQRNVDLFTSMASEQPEIARKFYGTAEEYLVLYGRYAECDPFLETSERMEMAVEVHEMTKQLEAMRDDSEPAPPKTADALYCHEVATLVALLVLNGRVEEAQAVCETARAVIDTDQFRSELNAALAGTFPPAIREDTA